jgi:hypothetical protein
MDSKRDHEIEQALAALASNTPPEAMPADVSARFDAHLQSLMAEDATVIRSNRFGGGLTAKFTKNTSWLAAASILTVMAFVGLNGLSNDGDTVIPPITDTQTPEPNEATQPTTPTDSPSPTDSTEPTVPTSEATAEPEIPTTPQPQDGATIYGNGEDIGNDFSQSVRLTNSGSNYGGYIGPIAEKILPLELPGTLTSLPSSYQACIKSLGVSGMTIGVDLGTYKGGKITAYWIATGTFERGAILVSPGCNKITFIRE